MEPQLLYTAGGTEEHVDICSEGFMKNIHRVSEFHTYIHIVSKSFIIFSKSAVVSHISLKYNIPTI